MDRLTAGESVAGVASQPCASRRVDVNADVGGQREGTGKARRDAAMFVVRQAAVTA
jgi:hypothetical protein